MSTRTSSKAARAARRRAAAQERAAQARRTALRRRWLRWGGLIAAVLLIAGAVWYLVLRDGDTGGDTDSPAAPVVGGDLHTVAVIGDAVYVGGHEAVVVSRDGGRTWRRVPSLDGADAMGWATSGGTVLVGGHPGLYRSTDHARTFRMRTGAAAVDDVHGIGAGGTTVYAASPKSGLLVSTDGGTHWTVRNAQAGRSFMGSILVDPDDPQRLIAPDMSAGLSISRDGGRTWKALGGPEGVMAVAWNPAHRDQLVVVGMSGGARSGDGGHTWTDLDTPAGVSAVAFDSTATVLYTAALDGDQARLYRSRDNGATWKPTS